MECKSPKTDALESQGGSSEEVSPQRGLKGRKKRVVVFVVSLPHSANAHKAQVGEGRPRQRQQGGGMDTAYSGNSGNSGDFWWGGIGEPLRCERARGERMRLEQWVEDQ